MDISILDCTLRDGGYYNNWDFDPNVVIQYLANVAKSKIEYVELGLRSFPKSGFLGAFAYTTEDFLKNLELPEGPVYGVMVDAKTILDAPYEIEQAIDRLFVRAQDSKLGLIRVAAHFNEVTQSARIVAHLKYLGYTVGFNVMQSGGKSDMAITEIAKEVSKWPSLDVLYFADSLGNMDGKEVLRIINILRQYWHGPLGIHTHNNMGKGLDNTLTAIDAGVTWIDSTVSGMGRGAGNTPTEMVLACLCKESDKYNCKPIYELAIRYFEPLQKIHGWGSNLLYFLAAQHNVHPTYIQNLLSNSHYGTDEVIGAIDYLSKVKGAASYNGATLDAALNFFDKNNSVSGTASVQHIFDDANILIVTSAYSTVKYKNAIESYIDRVKPIVISINVDTNIDSQLIDYYVISRNSKSLADFRKYKMIDKPVILPKCRFTTTELAELANLDILDYGLEVRPGMLTNNLNYCCVPYDITAAYILAVLLNSTVNSIAVVGFDGYPQDEMKQQEMNEIINLYSKASNSRNILALTPTSYPVKKGSIFSPVY